jgi:hypothetical protein
MNGPYFALGAMSCGTTVDRRTSMELLDRFVDRGGRWIDTANCYSFWADPSGVGGQSETVIGDWPESAEGLSAPVIRSAVQESLRRLRTDRADLYRAHAEDRDVPLEETVGAFRELVKAGLAGRLGASNHTAWRVERARALAREQGVTGWTALQLRHSYVHPRPWAVLPEGGHQLLTTESLDYVNSEADMDRPGADGAGRGGGREGCDRQSGRPGMAGRREPGRSPDHRGEPPRTARRGVRRDGVAAYR